MMIVGKRIGAAATAACVVAVVSGAVLHEGVRHDEGKVVHHRQGLSRPRKRNRMSGHEQQLRAFGR